MITEFESPEAEAEALSLLSLEERIKFRQRQFGARVAVQREADRIAYETQCIAREAERLAVKQAQKQRQASNHAARAAENQRIRNDRNSNRK